MFQPQNVTCPHCGRVRQIITEDIPSSRICVCRDGFAPGLNICAKMECPECGLGFYLCFVEKSTSNGETLFECVDEVNIGLQMWKKIDGVKAMIPSFRPNLLNRSAFERILDNNALAMANKIYPWQNQANPARTLADYLGDVEDYTQQVTWKRFKKKHLIVAFCAHDGADHHYRGFNGLFNTVKVKNQVLENGFNTELGGGEETFSKHYCNNKIGHCAEMHAANSCLNAEPTPDMNDMRFSIAYQCRTAVPRSYCLNCVTLFPNVNNG